MKIFGCIASAAALVLTFTSGLASASTIDLVRVSKGQRTLELLSGETVVKTFTIALGANPVGHKQQEGDERTPEGRYVLDYRNPNSQYYKSIHVSYPNAADQARARAAGRKPGGDIMIHGQKNGFSGMSRLTQKMDWTNGCIALHDADMEYVWQKVKNGTPIEIKP